MTLIESIRVIMRRAGARSPEAAALAAVILALSIGAYLRNDAWSSEFALWRDCVRKSPNKERPYHNLGYAYYTAGRYDEAKREFETALRLNPRYALSEYNLGLVHYQQGIWDKAIHHYGKAIQIDPNFTESFLNLGLACFQKGLFEEAIARYRHFLSLRPDYENGHTKLGLVYARQKKWNLAAEAFRQELSHHPGNPSAHFELGEAYLELRDEAKALHHLRIAAEGRLPHEARIRKLVGALERNLAKKGKGRRWSRKA